MPTKIKDSLTEKSNFLIQITHSPDACPEAIATKVEGGQGCIKIKVLEIDTRSTKENPYIAY